MFPFVDIFRNNVGSLCEQTIFCNKKNNHRNGGYSSKYDEEIYKNSIEIRNVFQKKNPP